MINKFEQKDQDNFIDQIFKDFLLELITSAEFDFDTEIASYVLKQANSISEESLKILEQFKFSYTQGAIFGAKKVIEMNKARELL